MNKEYIKLINKKNNYVPIYKSKAKQSKVVKKRVKVEPLYPGNEYEIMKLKIDNIRTVNESPIPCSGQTTLIIKNQFLVGPKLI